MKETTQMQENLKKIDLLRRSWSECKFDYDELLTRLGMTWVQYQHYCIDPPKFLRENAGYTFPGESQ